MRDPEGTLSFTPSTVVRHLRAPLAEDAFLRSELARGWVDKGWLVPFSVDSPQVLTAQRLAWVSHPTEWCDEQLHRAGEFTLRLQQEAVAAGFDLKDASAWNILFIGTRPVLCDLLSVQPLAQRTWWAAGQFARHFILPLLASRQRGLHAAGTFRIWRDGMPPEVARKLFGSTRWLSRYWPLMAEGRAPALPAPADAHVSSALGDVQSFRGGLQATLQWMLSGVRPGRSRPEQGAWQSYESSRGHYGEDDLGCKRAFVARCLDQINPPWVLDLGCNTGEFSLMARTAGAQVIAVDADHDSIQRLVRSLGSCEKLYPMVVALDDLDGGRGWMGREQPGLAQRLSKRVDLVMMLALVHHLAVACAVPLPEVAAMAAQWTRTCLLVEWVAPSDPQMQLLCQQRQRQAEDFSVAAQRSAFLAAGFTVSHEEVLPSGQRTLALLRLKDG